MVKKKAPAGAPEWMVTYGDCMSLLLCLFIVLFSMSEIKKDDRFMQVMGSINEAFGGNVAQAGTLPMQGAAPNTLIGKLLEPEVPVAQAEQGAFEAAGIDEKEYRVTHRPNGIEIVVGGQILFGRFSAALLPEGREWVAKTAERLRGYKTRILVRGHATSEALPADSVHEDAGELSYARARAVAAELTRNGVRKEQLALVAVGDNEPLVRRAFTEDRLAMNRRVEILVTEDLVENLAGSSPAEDQGVSSDGG